MATEDRERVLCVRSEVHDSRSVMVSVEDTGKGVEPSAIDRIFDPLFTTKAHGMGMGLSICRSIIEAHGGRLWVTANLPRGAIFHFSVPAHPDSASSQGAGTVTDRHTSLRTEETSLYQGRELNRSRGSGGCQGGAWSRLPCRNGT